MSLSPPFTRETAHQKVKKAQTLWNGQQRSPSQGQPAIVDFLTQKWEKEKSYRLRKELFAFSDDRIAVQFWYEYQDAHDGMKWKRCYGLEDCWWSEADYVGGRTFAADGRMRKRMMSGNDVEIDEHERWFKDGVDVAKVEIGEAHW
ncbi:hypothetical protein B0A49_01995 [Cryomyces minteri]|uniref:DUF1348 domain-containing protein n=1 Tax=Cryomyces minteri TaxID=331657 RepID=A0A4U0XGX7_9PEZI|nr:hypothetical protein B0A49_01995 [Cryomyces minteri]